MCKIIRLNILFHLPNSLFTDYTDVIYILVQSSLLSIRLNIFINQHYQSRNYNTLFGLFVISLWYYMRTPKSNMNNPGWIISVTKGEIRKKNKPYAQPGKGWMTLNITLIAKYYFILHFSCLPVLFEFLSIRITFKKVHSLVFKPSVGIVSFEIEFSMK